MPIALNRTWKEDTLATFFTYLAIYFFWRGKKTTEDASAGRPLLAVVRRRVAGNCAVENKLVRIRLVEELHSRTTPTLVVGDRIVVGFGPVEYEAALCSAQN